MPISYSVSSLASEMMPPQTISYGLIVSSCIIRSSFGSIAHAYFLSLFDRKIWQVVFDAVCKTSRSICLPLLWQTCIIYFHSVRRISDDWIWDKKAFPSEAKMQLVVFGKETEVTPNYALWHAGLTCCFMNTE